jgi:hypothetical protein
VNDSIQELVIAKRLGPSSPEVRYILAQALASANRHRDAAEEQAEFQRLDALRFKQRSGGNSYRQSNERGELEPHQVQAPEQPSGGAPPP